MLRSTGELSPRDTISRTSPGGPVLRAVEAVTAPLRLIMHGRQAGIDSRNGVCRPAEAVEPGMVPAAARGPGKHLTGQQAARSAAPGYRGCNGHSRIVVSVWYHLCFLKTSIIHLLRRKTMLNA